MHGADHALVIRVLNNIHAAVDAFHALRLVSAKKRLIQDRNKKNRRSTSIHSRGGRRAGSYCNKAWRPRRNLSLRSSRPRRFPDRRRPAPRFFCPTHEETKRKIKKRRTYQLAEAEPALRNPFEVYPGIEFHMFLLQTLDFLKLILHLNKKKRIKGS